jgi:hypothetical protein
MNYMKIGSSILRNIIDYNNCFRQIPYERIIHVYSVLSGSQK